MSYGLIEIIDYQNEALQLNQEQYFCYKWPLVCNKYEELMGAYHFDVVCIGFCNFEELPNLTSLSMQLPFLQDHSYKTADWLNKWYDIFLNQSVFVTWFLSCYTILTRLLIGWISDTKFSWTSQWLVIMIYVQFVLLIIYCLH